MKRKEKNLTLTPKGWLADVSFGKVNGKYGRVRRTFETKDAAEAFIGAMKQKKLAKLLGLPESPPSPELSETIDEFIERFILVHSKDGLRPKTLASYKTSKAAVLRAFRGRVLASITAAELERYKADRAAAKVKRILKVKGKKPVIRYEDLKPASINRELAFLKILFRKAVEWGAIKTNPAQTVKKLREDEGEIRALTEAEAGRLLAAAAPHLKPVLEVLLLTAMRKNEVLKLRWPRADAGRVPGASLVDIDRGEITIPAEIAKNHKSRAIPLSPELQSLFQDRRGPAGSLVFPFKEIRRSFGTAARLAGLPGLHIHVLRHTALTWMLDAGVDIKTVQEIAGHSSIEMTARYLHSNRSKKKAAIEKLSRIYSSIRQNSATGDLAPVEIEGPAPGNLTS